MLSAAIGLALAIPAAPALAQGMANPPAIVKQNMERKWHGISAVTKNDCAEGAHSCAGQATAPRRKPHGQVPPQRDSIQAAARRTPAARPLHRALGNRWGCVVPVDLLL